MSETLLLVDDDPDIRAIAEMSLSDVGGFEVVLAGSGREALELLGKMTPDAILLDVMMPGMDGVETFERLKALDHIASVPVIFVTAKVQRHERESYLRIGAAGVVSKPFDPMTLPEEVRGIIEAAGR